MAFGVTSILWFHRASNYPKQPIDGVGHNGRQKPLNLTPPLCLVRVWSMPAPIKAVALAPLTEWGLNSVVLMPQAAINFKTTLATASAPRHRPMSLWKHSKKGAGATDTRARYTKNSCKGQPDRVSNRCRPVLSKNLQYKDP